MIVSVCMCVCLCVCVCVCQCTCMYLWLWPHGFSFCSHEPLRQDSAALLASLIRVQADSYHWMSYHTALCCFFHVHYQCCTWYGSCAPVCLVSSCLLQRGHSHASAPVPPSKCHQSCYRSCYHREKHVTTMRVDLTGNWNLGTPVRLLCSPGFAAWFQYV